MDEGILILVADDDAATRGLATGMVELRDYLYIEAADGRDAWEKMQADPLPDVVLLDLTMPDMDGLDVCRRIRERESARNTFVILATDRHGHDDIKKAFAAGIDDYLIKPYDEEDLFIRLEIAIRQIMFRREIEQRLMVAERDNDGDFRDVTERETIEKTLRESEAVFRSVAEAASEAIISFDRRRKIFSWNKAASTMFGYDEDEIIGQEIDVLMSQIAGKDAVASFNELITTGRSRLSQKGMEMVGRRRDGSVMVIEVSVAPWSSGVEQFFTAIVRDVSERKNLEESLLRKTSKLEKAQAELERTNLDLIKSYSELKETQSRILQQEKMASIGQLAAGIAHEINNPMGFITSNLGSLEKYVERISEYLDYVSSEVGNLDEGVITRIVEHRKKLKIDYIRDDILQLIKESQEGAGRVKRIVQDLKSFSRLDEKEYKYADINDCLESTLNIVWNELKYKAKVIRELGKLPQVMCYPQQLNQVFMNLLVNAAQSIEKQGEITIRTSLDHDDINIVVADTGCGIPEENLGHLFEPFFTTKDVGKGTGLGLSIAYDIIKKHGGDIKVESQIGRGTTFSVRLPLVEES